MNIAYFDCFAGASGDMILGALVDAGLDLENLRRALGDLLLEGWELGATRVVTGGISSTRANVKANENSHGRTYPELTSIISASRLSPDVRSGALDILLRLAHAESRLHDKKLEEVYLHELGGIDTLIDIVGAVAGLKILGVSQVFVSALPMGSGEVQTRHGILPLPAPAVTELARGFPVRFVDSQTELVTPTGAAILTTLAQGRSTFPPMILTHVGYGAGTREMSIPNVLRVLIGSTEGKLGATVESLVELETNIDDMNPQLYDHAMTELFQAGALDVWLIPVLMKKNRNGTLLGVLCEPSKANEITEVLFKETTTLGVRRHDVSREALGREIISVNTSFGAVRVKVARLNGRILRAHPEYEDCRRLADEHSTALPDIYRAVEASIEKEFPSLGMEQLE